MQRRDTGNPVKGGMQLNLRVSPDLVAKIDSVASSWEFPLTRADVVRMLIMRGLKTLNHDSSGVRAVG